MTKLKTFGIPLDKAGAAKFAQDVSEVEALLRVGLRETKKQLDLVEADYAAKRRLFSDSEWNQVSAKFDKERREKRAEVLKQTAAIRAEPLKHIKEAHRMAQEAESVLAPRQMLSAYGIGSPRRGQIFAEASTLGPATLKSLMDRALIMGDREMAAALVSVNDAMKKENRPFDSAEIAENLFGEEAKAAKGHLLIVERIYRESVIANKEVEGVPLTSDEKISLGLLNQKIQKEAA